MSVRSQKTASSCPSGSFVETGRFKFLTEIDYPCNATMRKALDRAHNATRTGVLVQNTVGTVSGQVVRTALQPLPSHGYGVTVPALRYPPKAWPVGRSLALVKIDDPASAALVQASSHLSESLFDNDRPAQQHMSLADSTALAMVDRNDPINASLDSIASRSIQTRAVFASIGTGSPSSAPLAPGAPSSVSEVSLVPKLPPLTYGAIGCKSMTRVPRTGAKVEKCRRVEPHDSPEKQIELQAHASTSSRQAFDEADEFWRDTRAKLNRVAAGALLSIACVEEAKVFQGPDLTLPSRCTYSHLHALEQMREIPVDETEAKAIVAQTGEADKVDDNAPRWIRWETALNRTVRSDETVDFTGTINGILAQKVIPPMPAARRRSRRRSSVALTSPKTESAVQLLQDSNEGLSSGPASPMDETIVSDSVLNFVEPLASRRTSVAAHPPTQDRPLIPPGRRVSVDLREYGLVTQDAFDALEARDKADASTRFHRGETIIDIANDSSLTAAQRKVALIRRQAATDNASVAERKANDMLKQRGGHLFVGDDVEALVVEQLHGEAERYLSATNNNKLITKAVAELDAGAHQFEKGLAARRLMRNRKQVDHEDRPEIDWQLWKNAASKALNVGRDQITNGSIASRMQMQWIVAGREFGNDSSDNKRGVLPCYTARTVAPHYSSKYDNKNPEEAQPATAR